MMWLPIDFEFDLGPEPSKPCPNGCAHTPVVQSHKRGGYMVYCPECSRMVRRATRDGAVEAWDAQDAPAPAPKRDPRADAWAERDKRKRVPRGWP